METNNISKTFMKAIVQQMFDNGKLDLSAYHRIVGKIEKL